MAAIRRTLKLAEVNSQVKNFTGTLKNATSAWEQHNRVVEKSGVIYAKVASTTMNNAKKRLSFMEKMLLREQLEDKKTKNKLLIQEDNYQKKKLLMLERYNLKLKQTQKLSTNLFSGMNLSNLFAGYYLITRMVSALTSITDISDTAISAQARLGLYNESKYTNEELYNAMYQASQRSRTGLTDTSDLVNRILVSGAMTGEGAATESIRVAEIINKASVAGGGTRDEIQRSLRQLAQGLSSGALQGDELRSIREQTPFLAQMLAEGLNITAPELGGNLGIGDLKELGAKGEITSERILKAFTAMEDKIDEKFNQMPRTFSQSMTQINNVWTRFIANLSKGGGALDKVNKIAAEIADYLMSERGQAMLNRLSNSISSMANGLYEVWTYLKPVMALVVENTPIIESLIGSLAILAGLGIASKIGSLVVSMGALGKVGLGVVGVITALAFASTTASLAFQAMGDSSEDANKKVQAAWDSMGNAVMLVLNSIFWTIVSGAAIAGDAIIWLGEKILSVFGMAFNGIVAGIKGIGWLGAKGIDAITNNKWDLSSKVEKSLGNTADLINSNKNMFLDSFENTLGKDTSLHSLAFKEWDKGGQFWMDKTTNSYMDSIERQDKLDKDMKEINDRLSKLSSGDFKYHVSEVDKVNSPIEISSEDLKLLKDIATRDMLLNMTSVTPQANITFGDVRETADVNKIMDVIEDMVENAFATSLVNAD